MRRGTALFKELLGSTTTALMQICVNRGTAFLSNKLSLIKHRKRTIRERQEREKTEKA
jgi:hypothetical protein